MKRFTLALMLWLLWVTVPAHAQITIPYPNFVAGTVADPDQVDANNSALSSQALNRTGGTMTGTLTSLGLLPNVHDTYDIGSTGTRYQDLFLSGVANISGNVTVDTTTLFVDATNNRVGIGNITPGRELTIAGSAPGLQLTSTGGGITWGMFSHTTGEFFLRDESDANPVVSINPTTQAMTFGNGLTGGVNPTITVTNNVAGATNLSAFQTTADSTTTSYLQTSSTYTPSGDLYANAGVIRATGSGGLSLSNSHASGDIRFYAGGLTEDLRLSGAALYLGDTTNADVTQGFTINQGASDDTILAFKSSDVAHAQGVAETDTFGSFSKVSPGTLGGLLISAYSEATTGAVMEFHTLAATGSGDTTKSVAANGYFDFRAYEAGTIAGANENLFVIRTGNATVFIFDAEGDAHNDGTTWSAYDGYDDLALIDTLDHVLDPGLRALERIDLDASRAWLTEARLVSFDAEGRPFVNSSRIQMLHNGALRQMADRIATLEVEIAALKARQ